MPASTPPGKNPDEPPDSGEEVVAEMLALADTVVNHDLCSRHFPDVVLGIQRDMGYEPPGVVRKLAAMMRIAETQGNHYTAKQVAGILRGCAGRIQRGEAMPEGF